MEENKLHRWEEKHKELCFVNMQKNLPVYNLKTEKEDFIFKGVRLYQADDVDKIIREELKKSLDNDYRELSQEVKDFLEEYVPTDCRDEAENALRDILEN